MTYALYSELYNFPCETEMLVKTKKYRQKLKTIAINTEIEIKNVALTHAKHIRAIDSILLTHSDKHWYII